MTGKRLILAFSLLTGLFAAGYGVMFTILDDFRREYGVTEKEIGWVIAVGFFASFIAQVLFAPLADRGHARRLVYIGMVLNIGGLLLMAVGETFGVLAFARVVMGLGAGCALPALRRIVIIADPQNLGRNIGRLLAADVTGFALGPALAAVMVGPIGIAAPFVTMAIATVFGFPVLARVSVDESSADARTAPTERFAFDLLRNRVYVGALCLGAAVYLMIGTFDALWVLVLDDLNSSEWIKNIGITLFALPLIALGPIGGRFAQRTGPFRLGSLGLLAGAGFMFTYGQLGTGIAMFAVSIFHALSDGFSVSASGVAVGLSAPRERQAGAQGLLGGVQTLVGGVSAIGASRLYEDHGRGAAYTACALCMAALVAAGLYCSRGSWTRRATELDDAAAPAIDHASSH